MNTINNPTDTYISRMGKVSYRWLNQYKFHILIWAVYFTYESVLVGVLFGQFGKFENYVIHYSLNIFIFYFNFQMMQVMEGRGKKLFYLQVTGVFIAEMIFYVYALAFFNHFFTTYNQTTKTSWLGIDRTYVLSATYRGLYFLLYSCGYWFLFRFIKQRKISTDLEQSVLRNQLEKEAVTKELVVAQNAYLKAQINPHFLFNTLSFVHRRIRKTDEDAGNLIVSLANMMRYALDINQNQEFVVLSEEIEQVENLISLFQIKENFNLYIFFNYEEDAAEQKLIPLAMMTLAENIFKHGVLTEIDHPAKISLSYTDGVIQVETENKAAGVPKALSLKTGLSNLQTRIKHAYGENGELTWANEGDVFKAKLSVRL